jgi:hypothetical protein
MNKETLYDSLLSAAGDISPEVIEKVLFPNYDVDAFKIIYSTLDLQGNETTASGALFLPRDAEAAKPLVAYLHGTLTRDEDAPSGLTGSETAIGWMFAMNGYMTLLPDYLGMGNGGGLHPYLHKNTEAAATMDMIKAVKEFFQQEGIPYINDLYLCGYSQGGHAALATQQYIESQPLPDVNLKINVAGSGPYYLSLIQKRFAFENDAYDNASFLPYLLLSYQAAYGNIFENLSQAFVPPYSAQLVNFMDGTLTVDEIDAFLPANWKDMFQPWYLNELAGNYFHPANRALRANDLVHWKPKTRLRLYYTSADELVDKDNSIVAWLTFILQGASDVFALPVGTFRHAEAAPTVVFLAKSNFDCLSGVNPCPVGIKSTEKTTSDAPDDQLQQFLDLLQENNPPDPVEYLSDPQYSWIMDDMNDNRHDQILSVFPQPATDRAWIDLSTLTEARVSMYLYDPLGRRILAFEDMNTAGLFEINCRSLPGGIYTLIVEGSDIYQGRLVIAE